MDALISKSQVEDYRRRKWRNGLRTLRDMSDFLDEVGMALIFASRDIPVPKIYDCASASSDWWSWKDLLQAKKLAYNGRLIRRKATLVSMELLPAFLSIYLSGGGYLMYEEEYYWGKLGQLANRIAEYLDKNGPTAADALRRAVVPKGKEHTRHFHAALFELQSKFKTVSVGLEDRSWGVRVLGLFVNWAPPKVEKQAEKMGREEAMRTITAAFVNTAGAIPEASLPRVFGWPADGALRSAQSMVADGSLLRGRIRRSRESWLVSPSI